MPTVAKPTREPRTSSEPLTLAGIVYELLEHGIRPTPLAVLSRCIDLGVGEDEAVALAAELRASIDQPDAFRRLAA